MKNLHRIARGTYATEDGKVEVHHATRKVQFKNHTTGDHFFGDVTYWVLFLDGQEQNIAFDTRLEAINHAEKEGHL